jgi:hypothetical protein
MKSLLPHTSKPKSAAQIGKFQTTQTHPCAASQSDYACVWRLQSAINTQPQSTGYRKALVHQDASNGNMLKHTA